MFKAEGADLNVRQALLLDLAKDSPQLLIPFHRILKSSAQLTNRTTLHAKIGPNLIKAQYHSSFVSLGGYIRMNIQILSDVPHRTLPLVHQPNGVIFELPIKIPPILTDTHDTPPHPFLLYL